MDPAGDTEQAAREVHGSTAVEGLARLGLGSRGLVWLVVALLAGQLVVGDPARADQQGALRAIADQPLGEVLLVVLVVGFLGYAVWLGLTAAVGREARLKAAAKTVVYTGAAVQVVRFLVAGGESGDAAPSLTARLMQQPGGRWLVGLVGVGVVVAGVVLAVRALSGRHRRKVEGRVPRGALHLGTAGLVGRGLVVGLVGAFLVQAAVQADPQEARGLDRALHRLAGEPYGRVLLALATAGLLAYALWSFVEAVFHRHDSSAA